MFSIIRDLPIPMGTMDSTTVTIRHSLKGLGALSWAWALNKNEINSRENKMGFFIKNKFLKGFKLN
jgi:hypothetical protein